MGFAVMIFSFIFGVVCLIAGFKNVKLNPIWLLSIVIGVAGIAFAVYLGWPK